MISVKLLSERLRVPPSKILKDLCIKHRTRYYYKHDQLWYEFDSSKSVILHHECVRQYATQLGSNAVIVDPQEVLDSIDWNVLNASRAIVPTPVVALLGHFNHGKTCLFDALSGTSHVAGEVHGITQVVRTERITQLSASASLDSHLPGLHGGGATLVDTPGQDIFYRMRNYAASIADLVLLVVAVDDGICTQTEESIGIVQSSQLPTIVCINKIDLLEEDSESETNSTANDRSTRNIDELVHEIRQYECFEGAPIIPISATKHLNIQSVREAIQKHAVEASSSFKARYAGWMQQRDSLDKLSSYLIAGIGTVIDIAKTRGLGTSLHVVVRYGQVRAGDWFSAEGWSGSIRCLVPTSSKSKSSSAVPKEVLAGEAILLSVSLHGESSDPRPVGRTIYFHRSSCDEGMMVTRHQHPTHTPSTAQHRDSFRHAKDAAIDLMLHAQWRDQILSCVLDEGRVKRYRLEELSRRIAGLDSIGDDSIANDTNYTQGASATGTDTGGDDSHSSGQLSSPTATDSDNDEEDEDDLDMPLFIVKCNTDMSMGTVYDAYVDKTAETDSSDDRTDTASSASRMMVGHRHRQASHVIAWGIGNVTLSDVELAKDGSAEILCYNVKVDKEARQKAKQFNIAIRTFDRVQDVIRCIDGEAL